MLSDRAISEGDKQEEENIDEPSGHRQKMRASSPAMDNDEPEDEVDPEEEDVPVHHPHQKGKISRQKRIQHTQQEAARPPPTAARRGTTKHSKQPEMVLRTKYITKRRQPSEEPEESDQEQPSPTKKARHPGSSSFTGLKQKRSDAAGASASSAAIQRGTNLTGRFATPFYDMMLVLKSKEPRDVSVKIDFHALILLMPSRILCQKCMLSLIRSQGRSACRKWSKCFVQVPQQWPKS